MNDFAAVGGPIRISTYVLTHDSERYLPEILKRLAAFSDEILVVDSGSTDRTVAIAEAQGCRVMRRALDDFRSQREFATSQLTGDYVFHCDSDEIPSEALVAWMRSAKEQGLDRTIYEFRRDWLAFGRPVHAVYPVRSPDYIARLVRRSEATYERSPRLHERYDGYAEATRVDAGYLHYSIEGEADLALKLDRYGALAAREMLERRPRRLGTLRIARVVNPPAAFLKYYLLAGNWRDGPVGMRLACYAAQATARKYDIAIALLRADEPRPMTHVSG